MPMLPAVTLFAYAPPAISVRNVRNVADDLNPQPLPPKGDDAAIAEGNASFAGGNFAAAAKAYAKAVERNSGDPIALYDLALAQRRLGHASVAAGLMHRAATAARSIGDAKTGSLAARGIIIVSGKQP